MIFVFVVGSEEPTEDFGDLADHATALRFGRLGLGLVEVWAKLH